MSTEAAHVRNDQFASDAARNDQFASDAARNDVLVLVDALDNQVGTATKEEAHRRHLLHRAFSVVLYRPAGDGFEVLIAQRAAGKYHSAGLWANSCCSHPRAGEQVLQAAQRRVAEELGVQACDMREIGSFVYYAPFASGIAEYEFDHVLLAACEGEVHPDPSEVSEVRWVPVDQLEALLRSEPSAFAAWAITVLPMACANLR